MDLFLQIIITRVFFNLKVGDKKYWKELYSFDAIGGDNYGRHEFVISEVKKIEQDADILESTYLDSYYSEKFNFLNVSKIRTEKYDSKALQRYFNYPYFNIFLLKHVLLTFDPEMNYDDLKSLLYGGGRTYFEDSTLNTASGCLIFNDWKDFFNSKEVWSITDYPNSNFIFSPIIGYCLFQFDLSSFGHTIAYNCVLGYEKDGVKYREIPLGLLEAEVSVNENSDLSISISPNPVTEKLTLINVPDNATEFEIYDQFGNRQIAGLISGQIDVSLLPAGVHFIKLNNSLRPLKFLKI